MQVRRGVFFGALFMIMVSVQPAWIQDAAWAQDADPALDVAYVEVYMMYTPSDAPEGMTRLFFIDSVTGDMTAADVRGERFSVVGSYVIFVDPDSEIIYRVWPDGRVEQHPFIQPAPNTQRVDWVVSPDGEWIAWMLTNQVEGGMLQSTTTLARPDGTAPRVILTDNPDAFLHTVPIALTDDWTFFYDRQPQGVGAYFFYPQYAAVHRLEAGEEAPEPELLPFEPNCFCGAGISSNGEFFARLEKVSDSGGYDARLWNLPADVDDFAPTISPNYEAAGAVLVADDGSKMVYSLANDLAIDSAGTGRERYMLALFDTATGEQHPLVANPLLIPLLPLAWTEDGSGVLLYNPRQDGTWKLDFATGEVRQVAGATFVGILR
ncbi:hypothetical protein ACFLYO_04575 [Chloroflexota bacterium]